MTPRKELFVAIQNELKSIASLELVDLQRKQFSNPKETYGTIYTAALIGIRKIAWGQMVGQRQEGDCNVEVIIYTKDGWVDQHDTTSDPENGLEEIDLIDEVVEKLLFLNSENFKPLMLIEEAPEDEDNEMLSYKVTFNTTIYRTINKRYLTKKITSNTQP